jgi:RNA polymerase-binding transcription factor
MKTETRYEDLKRMLILRQRELLTELHGKMRQVRTEGAEQDRAGLDPADTADIAAQDDVEFALIQMKAETATKINDALLRLEAGTYGLCFECGEEIAQPRLRALPFAARCKDCEEAIETSQERDRAQARRASSALGFELGG